MGFGGSKGMVLYYGILTYSFTMNITWNLGEYTSPMDGMGTSGHGTTKSVFLRRKQVDRWAISFEDSHRSWSYPFQPDGWCFVGDFEKMKPRWFKPWPFFPPKLWRSLNHGEKVTSRIARAQAFLFFGVGGVWEGMKDVFSFFFKDLEKTKRPGMLSCTVKQPDFMLWDSQISPSLFVPLPEKI